MTSYILLGETKQSRMEYIIGYCATNKIAKVDMVLLEKETVAKQSAQSIGIEEIKKIQKNLYLKPIQSDIKIIVIEDAHLLTPEAQNALLKVLEEPPAHTHIVLGTDNKDMLLPTIHSRCTVIQLASSKASASDQTNEAQQKMLDDLPTMSIAAAMKLAEKMGKDKDTAMKWLQQMIFLQREKILNALHDSCGIVLLRQLQACYTIIKTSNTSPRLTLEYLLLTQRTFMIT